MTAQDKPSIDPSKCETDRPIFVVGCQRSGTTALAVMIDRHSRIAMMPETQFFNTYIIRDSARRLPQTHEAMVERALEDDFIGRAGLTREILLECFRDKPATYEALFQAILQAYAIVNGKPRVAEKSCGHLFNVDQIIRLYPQAKFICILRDGRDVVRSFRGVPWGRDKAWAGVCRVWNRYVNEMFRLKARLPADRFTIVQYEELIRNPEQEMRRLCEFFTEDFEPAQIKAGVSTAVVPEAELAWKGKAMSAPDPKRAGAWRENSSPDDIAMWNLYMGRNLRRTGYSVEKIEGISPGKKLMWMLAYVPYLPGIFQIAFRANRAFWWMIGRPKPDLYYIPME